VQPCSFASDSESPGAAAWTRPRLGGVKLTDAAWITPAFDTFGHG